MNDWTRKTLFWIGMGILILADVAVGILVSPMLAVGILIVALLAVSLVMLLSPKTWETVRPRRREKRAAPGKKPENGGPRMIFQSAGGEDAFEVVGPVFTIGRADDNDHIFTYPSVSRQHCRIICDAGTRLYYIENINGRTSVNGELLEKGQRRLLRPKSYVKFDIYEYIFKEAER